MTFDPTGLSSGLIALPPIYHVGAGTYTDAIPDNCEAVQIDGIGAGASGGVGRGAGSKASGASGAPGARIWRKPTAGATDITSILGAVGAGVTRGTDGATNGNDGSSSTISDGTFTLTIPGGKAGLAAQSATSAAASSAPSAPSVNDSGNIDYALGAVSSIARGTNTSFAASGGASCGHPQWGAGKSPGYAGENTSSSIARKGSGGASCYAASGAADTGGGGAPAATGGAGKFASQSIHAGQTDGVGTLKANSTLPLLATSTAVGHIQIKDLIYEDGWEEGSAAGTATTNSAGLGGGTGSVNSTGANASSGDGIFKGASGACLNTSSYHATSGKGGMFAASGAAVTDGSGNATSGKAGAGCGSGGAVSSSGTATSGDGGDPVVRIQFWVKKP